MVSIWWECIILVIPEKSTDISKYTPIPGVSSAVYLGNLMNFLVEAMLDITSSDIINFRMKVHQWKSINDSPAIEVWPKIFKFMYI